MGVVVVDMGCWGVLGGGGGRGEGARSNCMLGGQIEWCSTQFVAMVVN